MHPDVYALLAENRIADLRREADRDRLAAKAGRDARPLTVGFADPPARSPRRHDPVLVGILETTCGPGQRLIER